MMFIKLDNLEIVNDLCKICDKYKDKMDIDIIHGRYIIDGCSLLGVTALMGKIVKIVPNINNETVKHCFFDEVKTIGAYEIHNSTSD